MISLWLMSHDFITYQFIGKASGLLNIEFTIEKVDSYYTCSVSQPKYILHLKQ